MHQDSTGQQQEGADKYYMCVKGTTSCTAKLAGQWVLNVVCTYRAEVMLPGAQCVMQALKTQEQNACLTLYLGCSPEHLGDVWRVAHCWQVLGELGLVLQSMAACVGSQLHRLGSSFGFGSKGNQMLHVF